MVVPAIGDPTERRAVGAAKLAQIVYGKQNMCYTFLTRGVCLRALAASRVASLEEKYRKIDVEAFSPTAQEASYREGEFFLFESAVTH
jgi:hypothetical protein